MAYRYLRDPLFLFCFALYFANRWFLKPMVSNPISERYLNDLICIPFWIPIMLFVLRRLRLRADDSPPKSHEILIPLILWSFVFELWLPYTTLFLGRAVSDPVDILFYCLGALIAALFWGHWYPADQGNREK
jgi:hypothetical protein